MVVDERTDVGVNEEGGVNGSAGNSALTNGEQLRNGNWADLFFRSLLGLRYEDIVEYRGQDAELLEDRVDPDTLSFLQLLDKLEGSPGQLQANLERLVNFLTPDQVNLLRIRGLELAGTFAERARVYGDRGQPVPLSQLAVSSNLPQYNGMMRDALEYLGTPLRDDDLVDAQRRAITVLACYAWGLPVQSRDTFNSIMVKSQFPLVAHRTQKEIRVSQSDGFPQLGI